MRDPLILFNNNASFQPELHTKTRENELAFPTDLADTVLKIYRLWS